MCLLCEEKAKAIDKVETQESAATAIQALARQALRLSVMESWLGGCGDKEHPSKVVVLLAKAPAWRHAGLIAHGRSILFESCEHMATGSVGKCSQARCRNACEMMLYEAELVPSKLRRDLHQVRGHAVRC